MSTEFYVAIRCHHWHHVTLYHNDLSMATWILGPFHGEQFIHVNESLMEISFRYRRIFFVKAINVKFGAWHDSYIVVACVKFCSDMVPNDGVTQNPKIFPWIWITTENPLWNGPLVQYWFRQWLVSWRPQANTWTTVGSSVVGIWAFTGIMGDHNVHYSTHLFSVTQILSFYFSLKRCCNHAGIFKFTICHWIQRKQPKKQAWGATFNP